MKTYRARFRRTLNRLEPDSLACLLQDLVSWPEQFASRRERLYSLPNTFWLFLGQVLQTGGSCQEAVARFLARLANGGRCASPNTAAYCQARKRLPQEALDRVLDDVTRKTHAHARKPAFLWHGRCVKVVDGSSVSMPDTQKNQALYPQPGTQKPGCGFPVARLTVLFCLATGVVLAYAKAALSVGERTLFRVLWEQLEQDDVILADRGFCSYAEFYLLRQRGIDCVMRKHACRGKTSTVEKRFAKNDLLMVWLKTAVRPQWLDKESWRALPATLAVREIAIDIAVPGFRTQHLVVATTLLDPKAFPKSSFEELYRRRWAAELFLRDLKTTMGMDILRCKSPEMVHKELTMHLIAYNLLRTVMFHASRKYGRPHDTLSFKGTLATLRQWAPLFAAPPTKPRTRARLYRLLLLTIAGNRVPHRPDRLEPRARKRRPKNYQLLTQPRRQFKEIPHRNKYNVS